MDINIQLETLQWCKDWPKPSISEKAKELLNQCSLLPELQPSDDIEDIVEKSKEFPVPHPVENVRMQKLKTLRPLGDLKKNILSTYPLLHERVLVLMAEFLVYKREYGSDIEKSFYKDMTAPQFIDRLLTKRSVCFLGANDRYKLITGETGKDGWEAVGTSKERHPLKLANCLSYDEIKISALLYVSGHTECINDGLRKNAGKIDDGNIEKHAVIIGVIGPRFKRTGRMDYEDMVIEEDQNSPKKGYGDGQKEDEAKREYRKIWERFYQIDSILYNDVIAHVNTKVRSKSIRYQDRYVWLEKHSAIFDNLTYHRRLSLIAETSLLEADRRAKEEGKLAFVNVIGAGLGVWKMSPHQNDVFVLSFMNRIMHLMAKGLLNNVSDVNFAYISTNNKITDMFNNSAGSENNSPSEKKMFINNKDHPKGGINVQLQDREPSSKLSGEHEGKLLVMTYPWDGNAHPGNEFWMGKLWSSGDPAAACSTQISELHNAHVNPNVGSHQSHVASNGILHIKEYCQKVFSDT